MINAVELPLIWLDVRERPSHRTNGNRGVRLKERETVQAHAYSNFWRHGRTRSSANLRADSCAHFALALLLKSSTTVPDFQLE
jgi:hypothetical protein